jgi:hypothetical protein
MVSLPVERQYLSIFNLSSRIVHPLEGYSFITFIDEPIQKIE